MRKILLSSLLAATTMAMSATGPLAFDNAPKKVATNVAPFTKSKSNIKSKPLSGHAVQHVITGNGLTVKQLDINSNVISSTANAKKAPLRSAETATLFEGFESCDGSSLAWLPDGWSSASKAPDNENPWCVGQPNSYFAGFSGDYAALVNYSENYCDEYLITKSVTINEGEELSFISYLTPVYFYSMDNLDWDTYEYEGDKVTVQTLKVLVSEDNGETWTTLTDFAEKYKDLDFMSLYELSGGWIKQTISLSDYVGKTVKIAFEYVGTDGNANGIDDVSIDYPSLEVSYAYPYYTQFFGVSPNFTYLNYSIALEPVFTPLTWTNTSDSSTATYSWQYHSPDDEWETETGTDLTVTYHTDFSSDFSSRNNIYYSPTLTGSAAGAADGTYERCDYFQAGGKAVWTTTEDMINLGFCPFDVQTEGLSIDVDGSIPLFGYSTESDAYWKSYSFGDDDDDEGDYAYVDGIINVFQTSDAPIVIKGGWVLAYCAGIDADHEFTFEICPLTEAGEIADAVASTTIKGSDITIAIEGSTYSYCALPFTFEQPVSLSSADCDQYIVRLTGIHECADFFAPFQSTADNPEGTYHGFVQKTVSWMNNPRTSLTALVRLRGTNVSFAMMLDAEYPWLQSNTDTVKLNDNNIGTLALNSYYSGEDFTYEAPEWLTVSVDGVNDECVATFTANGVKADATEATVTLTVPGFSKTVTVKNVKIAETGINTVDLNANKEVKNYINLAGSNLGSKVPTTPGVYMTRHTDGTVSKIVVK
jgi:hypothetical protein